jgi:Rhodopirellula transposase DDE domain
MADDEIAARFAAIRDHLDERSRRLVLGAEARALGRGGVKRVAVATGAHPDTVARGLREVQDEPRRDRIRAAGAGRRPVTQTDPGLVAALENLLQAGSCGDPLRPLRWTTKSTRTLADELTAAGHKVSHDTVAALLGGLLGYSLQGSANTMAGRQNPDRDAQFQYINDRVAAHLAEGGQPVVSVHARRSERASAHASKAVCPDRDTASFAVDAVRRWWDTVGMAAHPDATRMMICADIGGSAGERLATWQRGLAVFADRAGLELTVTHMPIGTSKWEKADQRMFRHITTIGSGDHLTSHEAEIRMIFGPAARTGATARTSEAAPGEFGEHTGPTEIRFPSRQADAGADRRVRSHAFHGEWNYTVIPQKRPRSNLSYFLTDSSVTKGMHRSTQCHVCAEY